MRLNEIIFLSPLPSLSLCLLDVRCRFFASPIFSFTAHVYFLSHIYCVQFCRVFKKSSSNGRITVYLGKRDFVDHITHVDPIGKSFDNFCSHYYSCYLYDGIRIHSNRQTPTPRIAIHLSNVSVFSLAPLWPFAFIDSAVRWCRVDRSGLCERPKSIWTRFGCISLRSRRLGRPGLNVSERFVFGTGTGKGLSFRSDFICNQWTWWW